MSGSHRKHDKKADSPDEAKSQDERAQDDREESGTSPESPELSLREQLEAAVAERDKNFENWKRAQADLENYRKRAMKEADEIRKYCVLPLVRDLLPGLDNLQRGIEAASASSNVEELVQGVGMVMKQFEDILARHAAVPIEAVGQPFDPHRHEAVQQVPSNEHPPLTVIAEIERGFMLHERVVRPSKVVVSSGVPADASESEPADDSDENETKKE